MNQNFFYSLLISSIIISFFVILSNNVIAQDVPLTNTNNRTDAELIDSTGYSDFDFNDSTGYSDGVNFYRTGPGPVSGSMLQPGSNLGAGNFQTLVSNFILKASNLIIRLLVALSIFMFLYGLMIYMFKGQGSDTARSEGRKLMIWGLVGLVVITSVWGLVSIIASIIGHTDIGTPQFRR